MVDYPAFRDYVQDNIRDFLPEEYADATVSVYSVNKINNGEKEGFTVRKPGVNVAPTLYLDNMYEHYQESQNIDTTLSYFAGVIVDAYSNAESVVPINGVDDLTEDKIIFELVNTDANADRLSTVPHRDYMDLSIIYRYRFESGDSVQTVLIDNKLMEMKGYSEEQLYDIAYANTERITPTVVLPMREVIKGMMLDDGMDPEMVDTMLGVGESDPMVVISNSSKSNGAACMLYEDALEKACEMLGGNCYILPSSIHELIAVPQASTDPDELANMVHEVNEGQVKPNERLSNSVYMYDKELKKVLVAVDKSEKKMANNDKSEAMDDAMEMTKSSKKVTM